MERIHPAYMEQANELLDHGDEAGWINKVAEGADYWIDVLLKATMETIGSTDMREMPFIIFALKMLVRIMEHESADAAKLARTIPYLIGISRGER